jgi:hypothetical protein
VSKSKFKIGDAVEFVGPWGGTNKIYIVVGIGVQPTYTGDRWYGISHFEEGLGNIIVSSSASEDELVLITPLEYLLFTGRDYHSDLERLVLHV